MLSTIELRKQLQITVGDAFVIERELGGGGMSRVFVARETALGREVVIKVLAPELAGSVSSERFKREIELAAQLQHPNIVPLLSAGEARGLPYYTMPFVAGESLRARLARSGELPIGDAISVMRDLARALAYAHGCGIVHRDIKPDNVLLAHDYAVVTDFGVAKALNDAIMLGGLSPLTSTGVALGTPAYMAPEQSAADPGADHRVDIYAFGVVAYEVLTGLPPFSARNPQALIAAHATETAVPVAGRRPATPPQLATIVMRCLAKRPADRPQSADEIVRVLEGIGTSGETVAGATASVATVNRARARVYVRATAAAVLLIAIGAVAVRLAQRQPARSIDRNMIAVLPFRVTASDPALGSMREGMPDLIAAKLTGAIRAVDTRTMLAAWHRVAGASPDLDRSGATTLARSLGAGWVIEGEVVQTASTVSVSGTLVDVSAPNRAYQATAAGASSALPALVDTLMAKLLVLGAGVREQNVARVSTIPLPALQAYVAGQDLLRRGHYVRAIDALSQALALDSTFAQAALSLSLVGNWINDQRIAAARPVAARYRDRLSPIDQLILDQSSDTATPRSCADRYESAEKATRIAPDVPELWYYVGDWLFHCGEAMGITDAQRRALQAFEHALSIDSVYSSAIEHLPQLYTTVGDTAAARRAMSRFPDTSDSRVVMRYFLADERERGAALRDLARHTDGANAQAAVLAADMGGARLDDSDSLIAALEAHAITGPDRRLVATITRIVALTRGQPRRAATALAAIGQPPGAAIIDALFGDGDSVAASRALPLAKQSLAGGSTIPDSAQQSWMTNAYAAAQFAIATGSLADAERASALLHAFRPTSDAANRSRRALDLAILLDAQIAVLGKRSDAAKLTATADSMLRRVDEGAYVVTTGNPVVARLWERLGNLQRAYAASRRLRYNSQTMAYFATSVHERARLAAAAGDTADAIHQYRRYIAIRAKPEPALLPALESARAELARLEKTTGGK